MITTKPPQPDWGYYKARTNSWPLRVLIFIGLCRGNLKKITVLIWKKIYGSILDIEVSGIKYRLNLEDNVTDQRILTSANRYDRSEIDHLKSACQNSVFIDVGANIGFYTLHVAKTASLVIAIEPNPKTTERLRYNVEINEFARNIKVVSCGVGVKGEFELHSSGDLGSASMLPSSDKTESIVISTRPLIDIIKENKIAKIAGLKIDIEGLEDKALRPFFKEAPKTLWPTCFVIEHCHQSEWDTNIISHMLTLGYRIIFQSRSNTVLKISQPIERM